MLSLLAPSPTGLDVATLSLQDAESSPSVSSCRLPRQKSVFWLPVVSLLVSVLVSSRPPSSCTCRRLHPRASAEVSLPRPAIGLWLTPPAIVSGYQFAVTIGLLLASCVDQGTHKRMDSGSYRIPIALQFLWALILAGGLALLPESPRYYVKKDRVEKAAEALATLRGQPKESDFVQQELAELIANYRHEMENMNSSWLDCFSGGWSPSGNLRRVVLGTAMQCFQQFTGINFILYVSLCPSTHAITDILQLLRHHLLPASRY